MRKIDAKERKGMDRRIKKRLQKWRNRYKEIRNKRIDYVTHFYEHGYLYINLYFTDKTNFSLDFSIAEPAIVPWSIEYGDMKSGDYENIRTYYLRRDDR
jgi:hypothetical protein